MFKQVVQIDKNQLVSALNMMMEEIAENVTQEDSFEFKVMKPKQLNYQIGRAVTLLKVIELSGVRVDDCLYQTMKSLCRQKA